MNSMGLLVLFFAALVAAQEYSLSSTFFGDSFFDNFDFWDAGDPTYGYVHYVNQSFAESIGMLNTSATQASWGVDSQQYLDPYASLGRFSIRLTSKESWTHGLFVLDLAHMPPNQCGVWPAFWTLGSGVWPTTGEIDIIEYTNTDPTNQMSLHTTGDLDCTVAGSDQTGTLMTNDCSAGEGYLGCTTQATVANTEGYEFDASGSGGVYAMEWTSVAIRVWYWPRNGIPASIIDGQPDPSSFGVPMANFQGSCDIDSHFYNHSIVFDTTFCGSNAGNTWQAAGCPMSNPANGWSSCNDFVANNPQAFADAYWQVNYLNIYQMTPVAVATNTPSPTSIVPAVSTSSVTTMPIPAMGQTTTPSMSFPVTSLPSATNSPPPASNCFSPPPTATDIDPLDSAPKQRLLQRSIERGERPPGCEARLPGPQPAPLPLPDCQPLLNSDALIPPSSDELEWYAHGALVEEKRNTEAQGVPGGTIGFCSVPGMACVEHTEQDEAEKKRDAEAQGVPGGTIGFCSVPGMACDEHAEQDEVVEKRDAEAQGVSGGQIGFCSVPGMACVEHSRVDGDTLGQDGNSDGFDDADEAASAPTALEARDAITQYHPQESLLETPNVTPEFTLTQFRNVSYTRTITPTPSTLYVMVMTTTTDKYVQVRDAVPQAHIETSVEYVDGPFGLPFYVPTHFSYDPQEKLAILTRPTQIVASTIAAQQVFEPRVATSQAHIEKSDVWLEGPLGLPVSFIPGDNVPGGKANIVLVPRQEILPATTQDPKTPKLSDSQLHSVTCTPAIVHGADGTPDGTGCILPQGIPITRSEHINVASTTVTMAAASMTHKAQLVDGTYVSADLDIASDESGGSTTTPISLALSAAVGLITVVMLL